MSIFLGFKLIDWRNLDWICLIFWVTCFQVRGGKDPFMIGIERRSSPKRRFVEGPCMRDMISKKHCFIRSNSFYWMFGCSASNGMLLVSVLGAFSDDLVVSVSGDIASAALRSRTPVIRRAWRDVSSRYPRTTPMKIFKILAVLLYWWLLALVRYFSPFVDASVVNLVHACHNNGINLLN